MHSKRNSKVVPLRPRKAKIDKKYLVISSLLVILLFLFCFLKKSAYIVASETINRVYATEAVIVKNETLVNSPADGDLKLLVEAGERVRVNAPLFTLITDMEQKKIYEDDNVLVFYDIEPKAPVHFLVIPKEHISGAGEINSENSEIVARIFEVIPKVAADLGVGSYRIVTNNGPDAGQTVFHLHYHILGGKTLETQFG